MIKIDKWYQNENITRADCFFYPNDGIYRGNLFNCNGKIIGDYWCNDSVELEKRMKQWTIEVLGDDHILPEDCKKYFGGGNNEK